MNYVYAALIIVGIIAYMALCIVGICRGSKCFAKGRMVAGILWLMPYGLLILVWLCSLFVLVADLLEGVA